MEKCDLFAIRNFYVTCFQVLTGNSNSRFAIRNFGLIATIGLVYPSIKLLVH
jgi:hypothetical protein